MGDQAGCSKCHTFAHEGGGIGPDLSNLPHRDYDSVLRDIKRPNYAINPDYITQSVLLADGHLINGTVRTSALQLSIGDAQGRVTKVPLGDVDKIEPSPLSVMPEGLLERLGEQASRDLLTFLLTKPPSMPDYGGQRPPPPRTMQEVAALLAAVPQDQEPVKKLNIVLVTAQRASDMDAFWTRGCGAVYIHYAVDGGADPVGFAERIGLAWKGGHSKFRHGALDLNFTGKPTHPIARNFGKLALYDESYWQLLGDGKRISLLAVGQEDNRDQPLFWTTERGAGRVFVSIPGHFSWSFDDPLFRVLLLRGIAWAGKSSVDQFNDLVLPGARVE